MDYFNSFLELAPCLHIVYLSVSIAIATGVVLAMRQWLVARGGVSAYGLVDDNPTATVAARDTFDCVQRSLRILYTRQSALTEPEDRSVCLDEFYVDSILSELRVAADSDYEEVQVRREDVVESAAADAGFAHAVVGCCGFGKSSLCWKLAYDWATEQYYMADFSLVVLVPAASTDAEIRTTMADLVLRVLEHRTAVHKEAIAREMRRNPSRKLLLLVDGFHELPPHADGNTLRLDPAFGVSSVLVTCRSLQGPQRDTFQRVFRVCGLDDASALASRYMQRKFTLRYLKWPEQVSSYWFNPATGKKEFLRRTVTEGKSFDDYWADLVGRTELGQIRRSPLLLHVLYSLVFDSKMLLRMRKVSDFLDHLFETLLRRLYRTNGFARRSMTTETDWPFLATLGKFSRIAKGAAFTAEEARHELGEDGASCLLALGIFENADSPFRPKGCAYAPIHPILADYLVAVYLEHRVREQQGADAALVIPDELVSDIESENVLQFLTARLRI